MLNISENRIEGKINTGKYSSFSMVKNYQSITVLSKVLIAAFVVTFLVMFLPWTQNIRSRGYVTTLQPSQRPQTINSVIAGKIEKWFVNSEKHARSNIKILEHLLNYIELGSISRVLEIGCETGSLSA